MVRIKDIAEEAKVSEGTVDRVLHNRGGVSSKTEARIKKILETRNFSINPIASALAMKHKHTVAVLMPEYGETDAFWKLPHLGVLKASEEIKNIGINVVNFKFDQYDKQSYIESFNELLKMKPTAVLFVPMFLEETKQMVKQLENLNITYVFLNIDIEGFNNKSYIGQDSYSAGYLAGKLMHLCLPEASAFLIIQSKNSVSDNNAISKRITGFHNYFMANSIKVEQLSLKIDDLNNSTDTQQQIDSFLKLHLSIKGIFIPSSRISTIVNCLKSENLKKLKLIGFDNTPQNIECLKNETVSFLISQKPFDQGYESVRILVDFLLKNKVPESKIYLPIDILTKENVMYNDVNQWLFEKELDTVFI